LRALAAGEVDAKMSVEAPVRIEPTTARLPGECCTTPPQVDHFMEDALTVYCRGLVGLVEVAGLVGLVGLVGVAGVVGLVGVGLARPGPSPHQSATSFVY
jgi:hypothetical protein